VDPKKGAPIEVWFVGRNYNTSRKHCEKELWSFSHCGSFDHLDKQLLNDYKFVFIGLPTKLLGIFGILIYRWKGLENTFPTVYYMPPKF
jgi:hypothetical protein